VARGDYFGESMLFRMQSLNFYGDIVAGKDKVTTLQISREGFEQIPFYEIKNIMKIH